MCFVREFFMRQAPPSWKAYTATKIYPSDVLARLLSDRTKAGQTVATLNGSFDIMHAGHLYIIYEASKTADILVVALNTDASIKRHKGPLRPIIPLEHRMEMMAAISVVDFVTWFDEDDPRDVLRLLRPTVHVNGTEYGPNCIEAEVVRECGGTLHLVDRIPGLQTSRILSTIRNVCDEYGPQLTDRSSTTCAKN
jgi:rfaE bifunctional protein nucleotidyltransferase chain/domain